MGLTSDERVFLATTTTGAIDLVGGRLEQAFESLFDDVMGEDGNDVLGEGSGQIQRDMLERAVKQLLEQGLAIAKREAEEAIAGA